MRIGWIDRLLFEADLAFWQVRRAIRQSASAYCDLETVDDATTLVSGDGSLCSLIRLDGINTTIGDSDFADLVSHISNQLSAYLRTPGHYIQVVFERDTSADRVQREIAAAMAPSLATIRRLQLDILDVEKEKLETLVRHCAIESAYIVAWTLPNALTIADRQQGKSERQRLARSRPPAMTSQVEGAAISGLREIHGSLVSALRRDLRDRGISADVLDAGDALRAIRMMVDPEWTSAEWQPSYPGDGVAAGRRAGDAERGAPANDVSTLLWAPLATQLIPRGFDVVSPRSARIGNRTYQPVVMSMGPAVLEPFSTLFDRLREANIPYRISWRIVGSGTSTTEFRLRHMAAYLSTSRAAKRALNEAADATADRDVRVGLQISACTWVEDDDLISLRRACAKLARAIQGWGGCEVDDQMGTPSQPLFSTFPALRRGGAGPMAVPPIEDAVAMLPIARPASPWSTGSFLLRTPDGKLYPYQPYSSRQAAWVTLIYAPMGSGKSVLLAAYNKALAVAPGINQLPRISILDVGTSSAGVISLLREALPPALQHQVLYHRLRMVADDAVNPCDLPLGMRAPLPFHRAYLANLLTILATPIDGATPADVPHLAGTVIDLAYRECADQGSRVHRYDRSVDPEIDALIAKFGIRVDERTTWWEITDALYEAEQTHAATLAQRYAVPLLGEMAAMARDPTVTSQFRGVAPNQESITDYFYRAITMTVREYPILATATRLDLGAARIVSLDLADVVPSGGATADRQASVMYMLARHVLASDLFLHTDLVELAKMPSQYRTHHTREIQRMMETPKRVCYDEFHRTHKTPLVREQVVLDIREGRKSNLDIDLASQRLADFDDTMVDLATTVFILGVGERSLTETVETFKLNPYAAKILSRLGKPTADGAKMLAIFSVTEGKYVAELMLTLSPTERWAFSTTSEDRGVRDRLYRIVGPVHARKLLVKRFPAGSAKPEVDRRKTAMISERGMLDDEEANTTVIEGIVRELVEASRVVA
ncbi:MAG: hypothetical protein ABIW82_17040 [Dokdonella sp.]